jgi:hypothetical protein
MAGGAPIYVKSQIKNPFALRGYTDPATGRYALRDGTNSNTVEFAFSVIRRGLYELSTTSAKNTCIGMW